LNCEAVFLRILIRNTEQGKGSRSRLRFPLSLNCRQLSFLHVTHLVTGFITQRQIPQKSSLITGHSQSFLL
jgi:hypothetical protein